MDVINPGHARGLGVLREAFLRAGYTVDGVAGRLGPGASAALQRHETVPARRATNGGDALDHLVRLFLLQQPVPELPARSVLPVDRLLAAGFLEAAAGELRAVLDVRPYAEPGGPPWWVVSDLGTGLDGLHRPLDAEHVLGLGGASATLAQATVRPSVASALDVGTGCGVQALHLSRHSGAVVATDMSPRALRLASLTAALSDVRLDLRRGDLLEPVRDDTFDLIVSNPPFVVGAPAGDARHTYRDAGHDLDGVGARLAAESPSRLRPGGTFQMLANWVHLAGHGWQERVGTWLPEHGVDALVVQREVLDPSEYVATWLRDSGEDGSPAYVAHYDSWLSVLESAGVHGVGFGIVSVRRTDEPRRVTTLDWPHPVEQPLGPHVAAWFDRQRWLAAHEGAEIERGVLVLADDVVQEQVGLPGAEHPERLVLRQQVGLRRAVSSDTATAALAGACDGQLRVGTLVDAVRQVLGEDPGTDRAELLESVRALVEAGVLHPAG